MTIALPSITESAVSGSLLKRHPHTGELIQPLWIRPDGRACWPILGASPDDGGDDGGKAGDDDKKGSDGGDDGGKAGDDGKDLGYPKDTPVAEMTAEQQAAYFKDKSTKEEARRKGLSKAMGGKTAEELAKDLEELEKLRAGQRSESEKALKEVEDRVRAEERSKAGERVVRAALVTALSHLEKTERDDVISITNLSSFLDEDGELDTDKVQRFVKRVAPSDTDSTKRRRDFGGGQRRDGAAQRGSGGKAEAQRRFQKNKQTTDA
jgi:hypothetical protein